MLYNTFLFKLFRYQKVGAINVEKRLYIDDKKYIPNSFDDFSGSSWFFLVASSSFWEKGNYWLRDLNTQDAYRQRFSFKGVFPNLDQGKGEMVFHFHITRAKIIKPAPQKIFGKFRCKYQTTNTEKQLKTFI